MPYTNLSDQQVLVAAVAPIGFSSATTRVGAVSGWTDMGAYNRLQFIVNLGFLGAGESVTASLQQATDTSGTGVKALSPAVAITAVTASNKQAVINLGAEQLDANNGFRYAGLLVTFITSITTAASGSLASVVVLGESESTPPTVLSGSQVVA